MKSKQGFGQCYNAQAVVEEGSQLIVAQQVGQNAADNGSLIENGRSGGAKHRQ